MANYINCCPDIKGFCVPGGDGKNIKMIQYADDATCIASSSNDVHLFLRIFDMFQTATGATINTGKYFGLMSGNEFRSLPSNINWSNCSIKITGIVFGSKDAINEFWSSKVIKAKDRIKSLFGRHLTLLGKVHFINTFVYPLFYFVAPVFPLPDFVLKEMNKITYSFLWGNKPDLVAREVVCSSRSVGGLGLHSFKLKMEALFVKHFFGFLSNIPPTFLKISRYFMAKPLHKIFPSIWSNGRPNSSVCSANLSKACKVLHELYAFDQDLFVNVPSTRKIVTSRQKKVSPCIVRKNTSLDWNNVWPTVFNQLLDNKLKDFQWRLAHDILYTNKKVAKWGKSDGLCPSANCNDVETSSHIFWQCTKISPVILWLSKILNSILKVDCNLNFDYYMYGLEPQTICNISKLTSDRIRFIFCISKFIIWKSRCLQVFEDLNIPASQIMSNIVKEIKLRVKLDQYRYSIRKFDKLWIEGNSFVKRNDNVLMFDI